MATILVTGSAGFIGSNYVRYLLSSGTSDRVIGLDALTYAGNLENLSDVENDSRYRFVKADIRDAAGMERALDGEVIDQIVHFAAESHVDRSIEDPTDFLTTNIVGTQVMLSLARARGVVRFVHVSTDEVYGTLGPNDPAFTIHTPIQPNSPYAASKASSDLLVRAAFETHRMPVVTTRCSNNYGPFQFPEKLIPLMIANAMEDKPLPIYGDGQNVRDWIHVRDHCRGVDLVRQGGAEGSVYNIGAGNELTNLYVVRTILEALGKPESLMRFVEDRKGHDRRYAIDPTFIQEELGFSAEIPFETGIVETINWYQGHGEWLSRVRSNAYRDYYESMYARRLGEKGS